MSNQVKNGVSVILNLTSRIRIPKSADYLNNLYLKLCNIRRGDKGVFIVVLANICTDTERSQ